jgi:hypothetical protein
MRGCIKCAVLAGLSLVTRLILQCFEHLQHAAVSFENDKNNTAITGMTAVTIM